VRVIVPSGSPVGAVAGCEELLPSGTAGGTETERQPNAVFDLRKSGGVT
jgi:hypothetical protein